VLRGGQDAGGFGAIHVTVFEKPQGEFGGQDAGYGFINPLHSHPTVSEDVVIF
jgi:hypothetical protein